MGIKRYMRCTSIARGVRPVTWSHVLKATGPETAQHARGKFSAALIPINAGDWATIDKALHRAGDAQVRGHFLMKTAIKLSEAAGMISDGATLLIGGFMGVGSPHRLIKAIAESGVRNLTIVANDTSRPGNGIGHLITAGAVSKVLTSHIGLNPQTQEKMLSGEIAVELVPQGTLVERIRAGGVGLGGVLTTTGVGTLVADGKQTLEIDGKTYLVEKPIRGDFALLGAKHADYVGNLDYSLTAHNFNPIMAMAADTVIAEPEAIVPVGMITPDAVKTPGVLVDHIIERPH